MRNKADPELFQRGAHLTPDQVRCIIQPKTGLNFLMFGLIVFIRFVPATVSLPSDCLPRQSGGNSPFASKN